MLYIQALAKKWQSSWFQALQSKVAINLLEHLSMFIYSEL